ncbi:MAG: restriction endonuclease [Pseudomonadota bacterium]
MVRAGKGSIYIDRFLSEKVVGIGWNDVGDLSNYQSREAIVSSVNATYAEWHPQKIAMVAGQLFRFAHEIEIGDRVVAYDASSRQYQCGEIQGPYRFLPDEIEEFQNVRAVRWDHEAGRDLLSEGARNSLGSISTLFQISDEISAQLWGEATNPTDNVAPVKSLVDNDRSELLLTADDAEEQAISIISDQISAIGWFEMQELVAALLRAMGYKSTVSPKGGGDRGVDVFASPDGFGLEDPRIFVEVKHKLGTRIGPGDIRSFMGGRAAGDRCLYVSTGGFTAEARYEAEWATVPLRLIDLQSLVNAVLSHYAKFDEEGRAILALRPVYWPVA